MVRMDQWLAEKEKEQKEKQAQNGRPGGQPSGNGKKEADSGSGADV